MEPTADELRILSAAEVAEGWRLACRARAEADLTLEIDQWEATILADDSRFDFVPRPGTGIAVDIGTTTLVAQLVDLRTGFVLGVRSALNPQAVHGADVMSRIQYGLDTAGRAALTGLIREALGTLILELQPDERLTEIVLVGNTVMHHLFCGIDVTPLSHYPFQPSDNGLAEFSAAGLGWKLPADPIVQFLPNLGGFIGSDILAGILATGLDRTEELTVLYDLGTNGEIALGRNGRILCASTAAGPAFEGGRISMGMRAATGAIAEASVMDGRLQCHVLGNTAPRGLCGSGLVDVVAAGLQLGVILPSGRLANGGREWPVADPVKLLQQDIRQLQLAKGAIAAGARMLLSQWGAAADEVARIYLAGAFGNYVNRDSARRIGLVEFPVDRIDPAGNTALLGAKLALFRTRPEERAFPELRHAISHIRLADDPAFEDTYVDCMSFPA